MQVPYLPLALRRQSCYFGYRRNDYQVCLWFPTFVKFYPKIFFVVVFRSDVLGHILPIVGQDWAQSGVAQLFTKIKNNGYRILYLSARAIGQAHITREYLRSVRQGDLSLPDGPLLLNPTSLLSAFHRCVAVSFIYFFVYICILISFVWITVKSLRKNQKNLKFPVCVTSKCCFRHIRIRFTQDMAIESM